MFLDRFYFNFSFGFRAKDPKLNKNEKEQEPDSAMAVRRIVPIRVDGVPIRLTSYVLPVDIIADTLEHICSTYLNKLINDKYFQAISQPDGFIYCWTECVFDCLMDAAKKKQFG